MRLNQKLNDGTARENDRPTSEYETGNMAAHTGVIVQQVIASKNRTKYIVIMESANSQPASSSPIIPSGDVYDFSLVAIILRTIVILFLSASLI